MRSQDSEEILAAILSLKAATEQGFVRVDERLDVLETRFEGLDRRVDRIEVGFGRLTSRVETMETTLQTVARDVVEIKERLSVVEARGA